MWGGKADAGDSDLIRLQDTLCSRLIEQVSGKQKASGPFDLLHDESEEIRVAAVSTLKFSGDPEAVDALAGALSDSSPKVKASAAEAIGRFGRAASPAVTARLEEALKNHDFDTARFAAQAAGMLGSVELVPTLLDALICEDSLVASEAARSLGKLCDLRSQQYLIEALSRPDANVRFTSVQALGELGDPAAIESLEMRLREDEDEGVRARSQWAIKHIRKNQTAALDNRRNRTIQ